LSLFGATQLSQKGSAVTNERAPIKPSVTSAQPDVFARPTPPASAPALQTPALPVDSQANVFAQPSPNTAPALRRASASFDSSDIMTSIGEVPYEWTIVTDAIAWGANAVEILMVRDPALHLKLVCYFAIPRHG
jgi:hypothetical protein